MKAEHIRIAAQFLQRQESQFAQDLGREVEAERQALWDVADAEWNAAIEAGGQVSLLNTRVEVRYSESLRAGTAYTMLAPRGLGVVLLFRHPSEYALWHQGVRWHADGARCPTWSDATECRCMLGGES